MSTLWGGVSSLIFSLPSSAHSQEGYKIPLACRRTADYGTLGLDSLGRCHIHLSKRNRNLCIPGLHAVKKNAYCQTMIKRHLYWTLMYAISVLSITYLTRCTFNYVPVGESNTESSVNSLYVYASVVSLTHFRHPWKKGHLQISSTSIPSCI